MSSQTSLIRPFHDPAALAEAYRLLETGEVIAAPTDTVYGLMCRFDQAEAIARLYVAKGRPPEKAIPVLIADVDQMERLVKLPLSSLAAALAERFWPGPLTLILPALPHLPSILTAGQPTVGVRMPNHDQLRLLIRQTGPLAATSANRSGGPEAHTADEVLAQLEGHIPLILSDDEPASQASPASTIVDITTPDEGGVRILRAGPLGEEIRGWLAAWGHGRCSALTPPVPCESGAPARNAIH
ncbi:MAG TPA: L-threonylcarbamoyladenylate synthase [Caldilineaceae bacterium]|nr:L-threonylcarbamoyladenylate synthase [Caldilineaceae bacterium]